MKILFIGDIIGRPGRTAVKKFLSKIKKQEKIDLVFANGENLASGFGMTYDTYQEIMKAGVSYFTSGNHIFAKKEFTPYLDDTKIKVLRPINYTQKIPGRGMVEISYKNSKIFLINLIGKVFMKDEVNNPFHEIDRILKDKVASGSITIIDFHAEATSEKNSLAYYLDGRVTAVLGTHTHIQTNDARILPRGTAYITDIGMVGPINSSVGADLVSPLKSFIDDTPLRIMPAKGPVIFNAVLLKINRKNKAANITTINKIMD